MALYHLLILRYSSFLPLVSSFLYNFFFFFTPPSLHLPHPSLLLSLQLLNSESDFSLVVGIYFVSP